jgi:hypothetical protein
MIEDSARGNWENLGIMAAACGVTVTGLLLMKQIAPRILLLGALLWVALAGIGASSAASGRRARAALLGLGLGIAVIASVPALANPIFLVTGDLLSLVSFGVLLTLREAHRHWGISPFS